MADLDDEGDDPKNSRWDDFEVYKGDENDSLPPTIVFLLNLIAPLLGGVVAFFGAAFLWTVLVIGSRRSSLLLDTYEISTIIIGVLAALAWFVFYLRHFRSKK